MSVETKAVVTVSEMARMVGLSRARFYQLVRAGVFPAPAYKKGRPIYVEECKKSVWKCAEKTVGPTENLSCSTPGIGHRLQPAR